MIKAITSIADLTPDSANAREHNPRNTGVIVSALHQVGAARSIVIDEQGMKPWDRKQGEPKRRLDERR
jgi:hypothetical protein